MITCLFTLANLTELEVSFISPLSRPNWESRRPHPLTRSVLPALRHFGFVGVSEYLEDLVARIDSPLLDSLQIKFFHQLIFDTPQLTRFISRTPELHARKEARIDISYSGVTRPSSRGSRQGSSVGSFMHTVRLAAFISGTDLQLGL
jgi:hypothetical protein